jgi:hypothetical protein
VSRSHPERVSLGLSASGWALALPESAPAAVDAAAWPEAVSVEGWPRRIETLLTAVAKTGRRNVRITMAPDLLRCWSFRAPSGTRSLTELQQVAGLQFEHVFDEPVAGWSVSGDWSGSGASVCTAAPAGLVAGLREAVSGKRWNLVDAASAEVRLRARCGKVGRSQQPTVWVSLLLDQATLRWHRHGRAFKVCTVGVDAGNPWGRIVQEIRRVGSLWPDGAVPAEVHWTSACAVAPLQMPGVRAVPHGTQASSSLSREGMAAFLGCTA